MPRLRSIDLTLVSEWQEGNYAKSLLMSERIPTGTGKTTVVFFSTPISVSVCR